MNDKGKNIKDNGRARAGKVKVIKGKSGARTKVIKMKRRPRIAKAMKRNPRTYSSKAYKRKPRIRAGKPIKTEKVGVARKKLPKPKKQPKRAKAAKKVPPPKPIKTKKVGVARKKLPKPKKQPKRAKAAKKVPPPKAVKKVPPKVPKKGESTIDFYIGVVLYYQESRGRFLSAHDIATLFAKDGHMPYDIVLPAIIMAKRFTDGQRLFCNPEDEQHNTSA